jgi:hypothetical protein
MNLEVTLYVENSFDVKSKETKKMVGEIIMSIIDDCLIDENLFNFYKTKK